MRTREIIRDAKRNGRQAGISAASWAFDGNTKDETYRAVLKGYEEGDPAILDRFNPPGLSGEWADSTTARTLQEEYGLDGRRDPYGAILDEACTVWEDAAHAAFWEEIIRVCRFHVS